MASAIHANLGRITHTSFGKEKSLFVISKGLKGTKSHQSKSFLYHFKNVETFMQPMELVYGEIYKSKLSSEHKELNKKDLTYDSKIIDEFFSMSRFVVFNDLSIVFTRNHLFKDDEFVKIFKKIYSLNADEFASQIDIHYRKEDFDIFDKINSFSRLVEVELMNIRKSNPIPKPTFDKIEALLEKERTDVLNAKFTSEKTEGLARDFESHIMSAISIADSGYGDSIILGQKQNGMFEKIKLRDYIIRKKIEYIPPEEDKKFIHLIIEEFGQYISSEDDLIHD